jgi:rhomboid family GlyGly-CTERM serine protease
VRTRFPFLTCGVALLAVVLHTIPAAYDALILSRASFAAGEWWRLWSGHWIHFSFSHLVWDVVMVTVCAWAIEVRDRKALCMILLAAPPFISTAVLKLAPDLRMYAGLSGLATALMVFAGFMLSREERWRVIGLAMIAAMSLKLMMDAMEVQPGLVSLGKGAHPEPISHFAGAAFGALAWFVKQQRAKATAQLRQKLC